MNERGKELIEDCPGHLMSPNRNWVATTLSKQMWCSWLHPILVLLPNLPESTPPSVSVISVVSKVWATVMVRSVPLGG